MGTWLPDALWNHRLMRRVLDAEGRFVVVTLFRLADRWGRVAWDVGALADEAGVDDEVAEHVLRSMASPPRPMLYRWDGFAQLHDWDVNCAKEFMRNRGTPVYPEPPAWIWVAAHCSPICFANRSGKRADGKPGDYANLPSAAAVADRIRGLPVYPGVPRCTPVGTGVPRCSPENERTNEHDLTPPIHPTRRSAMLTPARARTREGDQDHTDDPEWAKLVGNTGAEAPLDLPEVTEDQIKAERSRRNDARNQLERMAAEEADGRGNP